MTACSFAVSAHVCWNWAVKAARTAIPLFILGHTLSTCKSLDMKRLGSIRRLAALLCSARRSEFLPRQSLDLLQHSAFFGTNLWPEWLSRLVQSLGRTRSSLRWVPAVDPDAISPTNCVRQALSQSEIGLYKSVVLANRLNMFWGLDWEGIPERLDPKRRLDGVDIVIGCVDTRKARAAIAKCAEDWSESTIGWIL